MSHCLARVVTRGESVGLLTPDPAMLHETQLTAPQWHCVCLPLFPCASFPSDSRRMSRSLLDFFVITEDNFSVSEVPSVSSVSSDAWYPVWSNCWGNSTHIEAVIQDPPPPPTTAHLHPLFPPSVLANPLILFFLQLPWLTCDCLPQQLVCYFTELSSYLTVRVVSHGQTNISIVCPKFTLNNLDDLHLWKTKYSKSRSQINTNTAQ